MKVLFLDVDGVLNRNGTKERVGNFVGLDKILVDKFLRWKRERPDLFIVLSSTWRTDTVFMQALEEAGITWISKTGVHDHNRGYEIFDWLESAPGKFTHIAILDDIGDMSQVQRYLVQTDERKGLEDKHLVQLDKLLGYD